MTGEEYLKIFKAEAEKGHVHVLAPTQMQGYTNEPSNLAEFYQLVDEVVQKGSADRNRVFLMGTSSGGLIARWLALNRPAFWRGVILVASPTSEAWTSQLKDSSGFPSVLFVQGGKDAQSSVEEAKRHVEILKQKGIDAELFLDPDAGHTHSPTWNQKIFDWIKDHS